MPRRITWAACLFLVGLGLVRAADDPKAESQPSPCELSLEVNALRMLYQLKATPAQLKRLARVAPETMEKPRERKAKVSKDYEQLLGDLRSALADANDEDRIDDLEDQLGQLTESEKPELDDDVGITAAARKQAPALLRQLKPSQVASFLGAVGDDVSDPLDVLTEAVEKLRPLEKAAFEEKRDAVADEVSRLVAGVDADRAGRVSDQVVALLATAHSLTDAEFKQQQAKLDEQARTIVGDVGPTEVLRHHVEHALARLLSNPRLAAAVEARLK